MKAPSYYDLDPRDLREDIRLRLNQLVDDGHATQRELAHLSGCSYTTFTLWLRGQRQLHSINALTACWQLAQRLEGEHYDAK